MGGKVVERLQRFSIRKLSIGAVSCLIGTVAFLSDSHDVQAAKNFQTVETAKAETEVQPEKAQESKSNEEAKGDTQNATIDKDAVGSQKTDAVTTGNQANTKGNTSVANEASKANEVATNKAETNTLGGATAKDSTQAVNKPNLAKDDQEPGKNQQNILPVKTTKLVATMKVAQNLTDASLKQESQNSILSHIHGTKQISEETMAESPKSIHIGDFDISIDNNHFGRMLNKNAKANEDPIDHNVLDTGKLNITGIAHNGDKLIITIPRTYVTGLATDNITLSGSRKWYDRGTEGAVTEYDFNKDSAVTIGGSLNAGNTYSAVNTLIPENFIGDSEHDLKFDYYHDGKLVDTKNIKFFTSIYPKMEPRITRASNTDTSVILPNRDYTYQLSLKSDDGVGNNDWPSSQVHRAINYGTTIDIPLADNFKLNLDATRKLNQDNKVAGQFDYDDINHQLIITVAKGQGSENYLEDFWDGRYNYHFVGQYQIADQDWSNDDMPMPSAGKVQIHTKLSDDGTQYMEYQCDSISDKIVGKSNLSKNNHINLYLQGAWLNGNLLLDDDQSDDPEVVGYLGFQSPGFLNYDKQNPLTFNIDFADGLNVTKIGTPDPIQNTELKLSNLTNFDYDVTLKNGQHLTGSIAPGQIIDAKGQLISSIKLMPNEIDSDDHTGIPGSNVYHRPSATKKNQDTSAKTFVFYGNLSHTYKDGSQVKSGDALKITASASSKFGTYTAALTQHVISPEEAKAQLVAGIEDYGAHHDFGVADASAITFTTESYDGFNYNNISTDLVHEPIFYYVLPKNTTYDPATQRNKEALSELANKYGNPKIVHKLVNGREVLICDYTGTGYDVNVYNVGQAISLNDKSAITNSTDPYYIAVYSPHTKLVNTKYDPKNPNNGLAQGDTLDSAIMGQDKLNDLYIIGSGTYIISGAQEYASLGQAAGNNNVQDTTHASSDDKKSDAMHFTLNFANRTSEGKGQTTVIANLPQVQDPNKNFKFEMTGAIEYYDINSGQKVALPANYQVLYSTELNKLANGNADLTGYIASDQVHDWSQIKSVAIIAKSIPAQYISGSFQINGVDKNLIYDAGKSVSLTQGLYADGHATITPTTDPMAATITIAGTSQINAKIQYTDSNGRVITKDATNWHMVLNDNESKVPSEDDFKYKLDQSNIPENYEIGSVTFENGKKTWQADAKNDVADFGKVVKYYMDDDTAVFHLVHKHQVGTETQDVTRTITINVPNDAPQTVVQTAVAKRDKDTDLVTSEVTYKAWTADELPDYTAPNIPGYVASPAEIGKISVIDENGNLIKNQTVVINYQKGTVTQIIHYVDSNGHELIDPKDDTGQPIKDAEITGTIETEQNVPIPSGWLFSYGSPKVITLPIPGKNGEIPVLNIKIDHSYDIIAHDHYVKANSLIDPAKPNGPRNGAGMDKDDLNQLAVREIHVVFPNNYEPGDDFLHQAGIRQNSENDFTITQTIGYMRDAIRDRITGQLIGYRMKYNNGAFGNHHLIAYSHIMLDSDAYKTNKGWMLDTANSALDTYVNKNGVVFFKQVKLPKINGYSWHIEKKQTVDNFNNVTHINNVPHMFTQYFVSFMALPTPKHNPQVVKSDTGLVEQSVKPANTQNKPTNTQNKPAIEKPKNPIISENTVVEAKPDTSTLPNNRYTPTSPATISQVNNATATDNHGNIWQIHDVNAAQHFGSNKADNSIKRADKHIIENSKATKTSKISKTTKLNSSKANVKTNRLAQPKLEQVQEVQEFTNRANRSKLKHDALPQTGENHNSLMAMLGLVISDLGMIGLMKLKKRKDN